MAEHRIWTAEAVGAALGIGGLSGWQARNVSIDSRTIAPGDLFIALRGERFDGHAFVEAALTAGAAAAVVERPVEGVDAARQLVVADALEAIRRLGLYARDHTAARYLAVTGSVGKTSTKEQLNLAFAALGETYATRGNFNNHIGLPLSLARMPESARFAVFEMGMNHAGEIAPLSRLVRPEVAVITGVEPAHLAHFASEAAIADAKAEIFEGLADGGTAVINGDNRHARRLAEHARTRAARVLLAGTGEGCDIRLTRLETTEGGQRIEAMVAGKAVEYAIRSHAPHQAFNTLFVLAAAEGLGCDVQRVAEGLAPFADPEGRGKTHRLDILGRSVLLVDDSYNASPASMKAAIASASAISRRQGRGRFVAALGDMLELGADETRLHAELAPALHEAGAALLVAAGGRMRALAEADSPAPAGQTVAAADWQEAGEALLSHLQDGDVLLVKGSHGSGMYRLAESLLRFAVNPSDSNPVRKVVA